MSMTKIAEVTVGAGGASSIQFNSIPQIYTDLKLVLSGRTSDGAGAYQTVLLSINGASTNQTERYLYTTGSTPVSTSYSAIELWTNGNGSTASKFGNMQLDITAYAGSNSKVLSWDVTAENNGTAFLGLIGAGLWSNTSAITSLSLNANFVQYSTATLYGISKVPFGGKAAKATGGDIYQTGAYTYHVFKSSGTFTPSTTLSAETLIIAGGGGGGSEIAGGGGAGGFIANTQTLTASAAYSVVVGAGGAGANYASGGAAGGTGGNSSLNSFIAVGGGGGGGNNNIAGTSGGSGGGSGSGDLFGAGTAGQGYAGGAANETGGAYGGGGGGGAGAVGVNGTTSVGGDGGAGLTTHTSWASATSTGSNNYYAGGGGGSVYNTGTGGSGTAGGGSGGKYSPQVAGTAASANTGSGGGGGYSGAAGGSGVVIIRYA
jgi:hypothetical protein